MTKAFKCDNCHQMIEGMPERRTPLIEMDGLQIVLSFDIVINGISGVDICNSCLIQFVEEAGQYLSERAIWPQPQGVVGTVDVVANADLIRNRTGLIHTMPIDHGQMDDEQPG